MTENTRRKCLADNGPNCVSYEVGDGNGSEANIGSANNMAECIELVQANDANANGATMANPANGSPPYACFKEVGQSSTNGSPSWVNCFVETSVAEC